MMLKTKDGKSLKKIETHGCNGCYFSIRSRCSIDNLRTGLDDENNCLSESIIYKLITKGKKIKLKIK